MAKWCGKVGYVENIETEPGIWEERVTERLHYGNLHRNVRRAKSSDGVNDNIMLANEVSIFADPFSNEKIQWIRYVEFMGAKWKVTEAEVQYPRIILTFGGVYNGE